MGCGKGILDIPNRHKKPTETDLGKGLLLINLCHTEIFIFQTGIREPFLIYKFSLEGDIFQPPGLAVSESIKRDTVTEGILLTHYSNSLSNPASGTNSEVMMAGKG